ncbi:MAG: hypothetical protein K2X38_02025 [Gemmataceae bacterium]|nr:hypothetical protein [Gemmataceae bacterium]
MPQIDWMHVIALAFGAASTYVMQRFGGPKPADSPFAIPQPATPAKTADPPTIRVILVKDEK